MRDKAGNADEDAKANMAQHQEWVQGQSDSEPKQEWVALKGHL